MSERLPARITRPYRSSLVWASALPAFLRQDDHACDQQEGAADRAEGGGEGAGGDVRVGVDDVAAGLAVSLGVFKTESRARVLLSQLRWWNNLKKLIP